MLIYDHDVPGLIGVRNGMIRIPRHLVSSATIGSSGDARIVRCWDGQEHYWARTLPDEIAFADLRRVQNWITELDPANWITGTKNDGREPVIGPVIVADGITWREVMLDPGSSGESSIGMSVALPEKAPVWCSVWLRLPPGSGSKPLARLMASLSASWGSATRWSVSIDETPKRFANRISGYESQIGCRLLQQAGHGPITLWIGIDPQHCAMADICPKPYEGNAFDYAAEIIAPDVDYGFGAPGVAYFGYENPFSVDSNGVVTDTGARTPLGRGGLIVAGADTNPLAPSYTTSAGGWTKDSSVSWVGVGKALPGLPAPEGFQGDGVDVYTWVKSNAVINTTAGQKVWLHAIVEVVGGADGEDSECSLRASNIINRTYLRKGTGAVPESNASITYSRYESESGPNGGDLYEFIAVDTEPNSSAARSFYCFSDHDVASQKIAYVHYVHGTVDKPVAPLALLVNTSTTSSASRVADLMPLRWRPGLGWSPGRRLRSRFTIDTSSVLVEGTILGGEDQTGTTQAALVRLVYDSGAAEYRIQVSDGTATWIAPVAVPQAAECVISVDAGPAGASVTVQGIQVTTSNAFNFSWVDETYVGSLPDGTDHVGIPLNVEPEVV